MKYFYTVLFSLGAFFSHSQFNGTVLFDESYVHEIRIDFEQEEFWDSLSYYYSQYLDFGADKEYMIASVTIDGTEIDSVGVRQKGFYSNWGASGVKKPLKIDFNEYVSGQKYDGLKKLNLQNGFSDPTIMRDALAYHFMREAGIIAPRTAYAKVYLNDTYWGLYVMVEQVDDRFTENNFENNKGNIFKCINNTQFKWQGINPTNYQDEFELKTNEELDNWDSFIDLADKINDEDDFEDSISTALQMNNYTQILAADVLMNNWDSYYDHGRNFYIYEDSAHDVFQWIPWDYNLAFSKFETDIVITYDDFFEEKPLVEGVMNSDIYRTNYFNHLCIMVENSFNLDALEGYINATRDLIYDAVDEDPNKFYSITEFSAAIENNITVDTEFGPDLIPGLKSFINERVVEVTNQLNLESHSCTSLNVEDELTSTFTVYPNPSTSGLFMIQGLEATAMVNVHSSLGQMVYQGSNLANETLEIDLSHEERGFYFLEIISNGEITIHKLIRN